MIARAEGPRPDYHGPTTRGDDGRSYPVPDTVHERFHESVRDVLDGKVLPAAREQMNDALRRAPGPTPHPTSTQIPLSSGATAGPSKDAHPGSRE